MNTPTPPSFVTNAEIDEAIIVELSHGKPLKSIEIGGRLRRRFSDERLPSAGGSSGLSPIWKAQELGNRSCQRLRKAGRAIFDSKLGWRLPDSPST